MSKTITYPLTFKVYLPSDTQQTSPWYTTTVVSGPQVGEEGFWIVRVNSGEAGSVNGYYGGYFAVNMNYAGETAGSDLNYSVNLANTVLNLDKDIQIPALANWRSIIVEKKTPIGDYYAPSTGGGGGDGGSDTPVVVPGGSGFTNDGGYSNTGGSGGITAFQSSMRQRFVRHGTGLALTEGTSSTQAEYSPVVTITREAFSTVDRKQWNAFKAERESYSATFGTTPVFTSSTPGAQFPDSVGAYPITWSPLLYTVNVAVPAVGVAGTCTFTVNVVQDLQPYKRQRKKLGGPPDNPFMVDRTEEDGFPINPAVYPHVIRFYYQVWASNAGRSASFGGTQAQTDRIQIPMLVEYPVQTYPTAFSFELPAYWWGIEITNGGQDGTGVDAENNHPTTPSKNGSDNLIGIRASYFMGVAPKFTYTETSGGEYIGDKTVTTGGTYDPFGDVGEIGAFQSAYAQQLVREGGILDLDSGATSETSSSGGGDDVDDSTFTQHTFTHDGATLVIGAGPVSVRSSGFSIPSWLWSVSYSATAGSNWRVVITADGQFEDGFDIPSNGTPKRYADGTKRSAVFDFATYSTAPTWSVINLNEGTGTKFADQNNTTDFGYTPVSGG